MYTSTQKLVAALEELRHSRDDSALDEIITLARREQFHDYASKHLFPGMDLIRRLKEEVGYTENDIIIREIRQGAYSVTQEESEEWFRSPEGHGIWPGHDDGL